MFQIWKCFLFGFMSREMKISILDFFIFSYLAEQQPFNLSLLHFINLAGLLWEYLQQEFIVLEDRGLNLHAGSQKTVQLATVYSWTHRKRFSG